MVVESKKPDILYEDDHILVIRKPAYFPVQSASLVKADCVSFLKNYLHDEAAGYSGSSKKEPYLAVIHRLDEPVEGIVVFAKKKKAAAEVSKQLQNGGFKKKYTAAVKRSVSTSSIERELKEKPPASGKIRLVDYMIKEKAGNTSKIVSKDITGAKKAELIYEVKNSFTISEINSENKDIKEKEEIYLLDIELLTGRHHQIRLQLKNAGYPVIGDRKYGNVINSDIPLCLCADRLSFRHPENHKMLEFDIEPEFIKQLTDRMDKNSVNDHK